MGTITAIFTFLAEFFGFGRLLIPSEKLQEIRHEEKKPKLSAIQFKGLYNDEFRRLKNHWEITIETDVRFVNGALSKEDQDELITLLKQRIDEHRRKFHPIRYKRWLAENPNSPNLPK